MPNRERTRRRGPDLLLVVEVFSLILVLGILTTGPLAPEPSVIPGDEETARARIARDARAAPARLTCLCAHPTIDSSAPLAQPIPGPEELAVAPSASRAAPDYLIKMATLLRRRPPYGPTPDPYQLSLNPAVYGLGVVSPTQLVQVEVEVRGEVDAHGVASIAMSRRR